MNPVWASGRLETVLRWIEWFPTNTRIEEHPAIAVHGALIHALTGNAGDAERWATAAERTTFTGTLPDGNTMEGTLAYLHTLMCRNGLEAMSRDAESALQGLSPTSPYRSTMLHAQGVANLLAGELDSADLHFARAIEEATSAGTLPFLALLLTERGIVATEREAWAEADALAQQALSMMTDGQYDDYWTSALVYAWCAHVAARRGDPAQARDLASRAARLRPLLTHALPVVSAQALLELARAYIALAEPGGASAVLRQAKDLLQHRPDLGAVPKQVAELRSKLETLRVRHGRRVGPHCCRAPFAPASCRPTSRFRRSAIVSSSRVTPSSPRRSLCTGSSASPRAVRPSRGCSSSTSRRASRATERTSRSRVVDRLVDGHGREAVWLEDRLHGSRCAEVAAGVARR